MDRRNAVASELMLQNLDLVFEGHGESLLQIRLGDVFLYAIGPSIEASFAPSSEVEDGLAQGLAGDGPGMDRYAAKLSAFFDDEDLTAGFGTLDGRAPTCRSAADDDQIKMLGQ